MSLRQLKKERTRHQLGEAAYDLFRERGYEATTVEEICAAVEVSPRTFFRYYPTKEDVLLDLLRVGDASAFVAALAARPPDEALAASLRAAGTALVSQLEADTHRALRLSCLVNSVPAVRSRLSEIQRLAQDEITGSIARRLRLDPAIDMRPQLIAAFVMAVLATAVERWELSDDPDGPQRLAGKGFDLLESGLSDLCGKAPA
jgi:AcrR family transcriptional regulator